MLALTPGLPKRGRETGPEARNRGNLETRNREPRPGPLDTQHPPAADHLPGERATPAADHLTGYRLTPSERPTEGPRTPSESERRPHIAHPQREHTPGRRHQIRGTTSRGKPRTRSEPRHQAETVTRSETTQGSTRPGSEHTRTKARPSRSEQQQPPPEAI